jgi:predicted XRE-type DNA-binding protein
MDGMEIIRDAMQAMESVMSDDEIARSNEIYKQELLMLNLAELREQYNIKQADLKGFSQPAISRIERRKDIKLSTLIKYLKQMDLDIEIKVRPRNPKNDSPDEVLLFHS